MDQNSIIDKNSFEIYEHAEDYPNIFICDKRIASSIAFSDNSIIFSSVKFRSSFASIRFSLYIRNPEIIQRRLNIEQIMISNNRFIFIVLFL